MTATGGTPTADDGWRIAGPEQLGLRRAVLDAAGDRFEAETDLNVHSLLIARHGVLAYERYFSGADENWDRKVGRVDFDAGTRHDVRSVTKSVTALLIGIAIDRKMMGDIDTPVFRFFPDCADLRTPAKDGILLRHLLTMSTGLDWDEYRPYTDPQNTAMRMYGAADRLRFVLGRPMVTPPGSFFRYDSGATMLLGAALQKATGLRLDAFAREAFFGPLGIDDVEWATYADGMPSPDGGLRLRPRDMARIGQLILDRGLWNGRQVVPAAWIGEAVAPHLGRPDGVMFYGYQWWLGRSLVNRREVPWIAALGLGGQAIFIVPGFDLVVAMTAGLYAHPAGTWLPTDILNRYVLAAIEDQVGRR